MWQEFINFKMLPSASLIARLNNFNPSPFSWPWACLPKEAGLPENIGFYEKLLQLWWAQYEGEKRLLPEQTHLSWSGTQQQANRGPERLEWSRRGQQETSPAQREEHVQRPRGKRKEASCKELKQFKTFTVAGVQSSSGRVRKDETDSKEKQGSSPGECCKYSEEEWNCSEEQWEAINVNMEQKLDKQTTVCLMT